MSAYFARVARHGFQVRRVRVVEWPLTPYLQWELHALRQREQCGADIRILGADRVRELEQGGVLPEIYTLGTSVMYEAVYGGDGVLAHAIKFIDESLIVQCQRIISELYGAGEPLADYFEREVAPLPAPTVERSQ